MTESQEQRRVQGQGCVQCVQRKHGTSCLVFRLWRLVLPGRGDSAYKSQGHVTHFSATQRIGGAEPKIFNSIGHVNLFFST